MKNEIWEAMNYPYGYEDPTENAETFKVECRSLLEQHREWRQISRAGDALFDRWLADKRQTYVKREYDRLNAYAARLERYLKANREILANHPNRPRQLATV